jgi:hypothetical protein
MSNREVAQGETLLKVELTGNLLTFILMKEFLVQTLKSVKVSKV